MPPPDHFRASDKAIQLAEHLMLLVRAHTQLEQARQIALFPPTKMTTEIIESHTIAYHRAAQTFHDMLENVLITPEE